MLNTLDIPAQARHDPMEDARRADLVYVNDSEPGIRRRRAGKGFYYLGPGGGRLEDAETLARIRKLAIPPAWTDVWICTRADGHIQATGRDQRGRKQYRYHPDWFACRDEVKFSTLATFAEALPKLRARVDHDLRLRGIPMERAIASIVWLLDNTMIRIGNESYTRENKSFGLTTLRTRHLEVEGARLRFSFVGKSGQEWKLKLADRRIARIVRAIQELPGQHLFQYIDEEGNRRPVDSNDVNAYIHAYAGEAFTSKHFRTWGATRAAAIQLAVEPPEPSKRARNRQLNAIIDLVARRLNNTRAVCRRCYIHPAVLNAWEDGRLAGEMLEIRRGHRRPFKGLSEEESLVLRWLRQNNGH
ncbi:DNA topoisomerase IB [Chelativorans sp. AA-79]|uniref:DNA topoisomerase IB n=1 Tax=Chelativorans sp. AA-79 TaxID=3028735 RepID=UPI0023F9E856|nr:DNA topoisomerase IB [Chelativorans sp. AA-79]WEX10227.1 DNA topoisomerase IB [Chelativorans sp. AA-79]